MYTSRYGLAALVAAALATATGCGPSLTKVKGVVKLDGAPVEGATVAFMSEDGNSVYSGFTDASGEFTLTGQDGKTGVPAGSYKVTVVKHQALAGGEASGPGSPDYMKQMEKMSKEGAKSGMGGPGMMMPGMPKGGGPGGTHEKSELPLVYSGATTTPISVKIPPPSSPVPIELKSKP